jgi:pimeloyl-ACP methyl ester carboxylesterase
VTEHLATVGDVELCYETFGDSGDPAVLLVMGLGTQMIAWREDFCQELVDRGFFVIRFDNRDCGRSTRFDGVPPPTTREIITRRPRHVAYTLDDMAQDAAGLLDHLDVDAAHVVGASMGGMVAQMMAANHSEKVRSLVSIMSSTGSSFVGHPSPRAWPVLLRRPPRSREEYIAALTRVYGIIGSPGFEPDLPAMRELLARSFDRGVTAAGTGRQLSAIFASGNRTPALRRIDVPTTVVHGTADRLVSPSGGRATARAIRGAKLVMIPGMGHDLPRGAWPRIVDAIADTASRAGQPATV